MKYKGSFHDIDSIPLGKEIESILSEEERFFLLGKLKSHIVVEEGGFT